MFTDSIWYADYYRTTDDKEFIFRHFVRDLFFQHRLRFMIYFRKAQHTNNRLLKAFYDWKLYQYSRKYGIEIKSETKIGKGFCMLHPYNITVSPVAEIGDNVTMMKGSTIGLSVGGAPKIGDRVYIGLNSTVIGKITIGDDVLIGPNTMVNVDVPSHSVVIGSPCKIVHKENPTIRFLWKTL